MLWLDFNLLTSGNRFADLWIELIYRATAACLNIIMLIPLKTWNEEKGQDGICHKYVVSAITATNIANDGLSKIQVFLQADELLTAFSKDPELVIMIAVLYVVQRT